MNITRRAGLQLAGAAFGASLLPTFAAAQSPNVLPTSFRHPVGGGEVVIHPVAHASFVLETPGGVVYVDPVNGAEAYRNLPEPQLILITHEHGDHFDLPTLQGLAAVRLITNGAVHAMLPPELQARATSMANGERAEVIGLGIEAIPAYNITAERAQYHPMGRDNGYVLTIGGQRFYIAGDTEDTPEMRALTDIHVALLPMNLPFTMTVDQAADAVAAFQPETLYPYHHRGSDLAELTRLIVASGAPTKIVIANWYPAGDG